MLCLAVPGCGTKESPPPDNPGKFALDGRGVRTDPARSESPAGKKPTDASARSVEPESGPKVKSPGPEAERKLEPAIFKGSPDIIRAVAFSPDGKTVASGSDDNAIRLWDVASGTLKATLKGHSGILLSLAFSPDGTTLASGAAHRDIFKGEVKLWNLVTGEELKSFEGHRSAVRTVAFRPHHPKTLASGDVGSIHLWDVDTGKDLAVFEARSGFAFSPDGNTLAAPEYRNGRDIILWEVATKTIRTTLKGHDREVLSLAFSPDGKHLASGGDDSARLWDLGSGKDRELISIRKGLGTDGREHDFRGRLISTQAVAFSPDGQTLALIRGFITGPSDQALWLYDVATAKEKPFPARTSAGHRIAFSPRGNLLAAAEAHIDLRVWEVPADRK